jgi:hypothetical protein
MPLEGSAATYPWRQDLSFLNLRVLMQLGFSRKAELKTETQGAFLLASE